MKKLIVLFLMFIAISTIWGQSKKELYNKLKGIEGDIKSLTITTDKGNVTFKGDDAEYLFKKLKSAIKLRIIKQKIQF